VSSFHRIITIVLLALWLPITQHCGLEAAGLIAQEPAHAPAAKCCEKDTDPCTHDGCQVIEGHLLKHSNDVVKVQMPTLAACTCFLCLQLLTPGLDAEPALTVVESDRPQHWIPVWQFVRRAAPLSRAPSLLG
jgi:hypothetical protein